MAAVQKVQPLWISLETAALPHFSGHIGNLYRALFTMQLNIGQLSELSLPQTVVDRGHVYTAEAAVSRVTRKAICHRRPECHSLSLTLDAGWLFLVVVGPVACELMSVYGNWVSHNWSTVVKEKCPIYRR